MDSSPSILSLSSRETIEAEDRAFAQITNRLAALRLHPPPAAAPSANPTSPSKQKSAKESHSRPPKRTGARDNNTNKPSQSPSSSGNTHRHATSSTKNNSTSSNVSKPALSSGNNREPNDEELENVLRDLVRLSTTGSVGSESSSSSSDSTPSLESNLMTLIELLVQRSQHLGPLCAARHQFALFLVAVYRRSERISTLPSVSSRFQPKWTKDALSQVITLLLQSIRTSYSPIEYLVHVDSLRALSLIIFDNVELLSHLSTDILNCLRPLVDVRLVTDKEVQRIAFNCISNMCYKSGNHGSSYYEDIWRLFMKQLAQLQPQVLSQVSLSRVFAALLRGVQFVITEAKTLHEPVIPSLVSTLHKFVYYGTPLSTTGLATNLSVDLNSDSDDELASNGSNYSGSDVYNDKHGVWKVRFHALGCLQAAARGKAFAQFWPQFLPQSAHQPSIVSLIHIDPVHQVRSAACRLLSAMFDDQKAFLETSHFKMAKPTSSRTASPMSFTPLSTKLASMLTEVHTGLYQALTAETRPTTISAIIKTLGVLAHETPYDVLPPGTLSKFISHLAKTCLDRSVDPRLLKVSLASLAAFISARISTSEVRDLINPASHPLIGHLELMLKTEASNQVLLSELFRFFASLAAHFPDFLIPSWDSVFTAILQTSTGESVLELDPNVRYSACKVVEDLSKSLVKYAATIEPLASFSREFWPAILNSPITELMVKDRFGLVRSSICSLFSQVPAPIFASLSGKHQVACITLLLGATKDDVPAVRAQAARALGIYILNNNALQVDPLFVSDVALALVDCMKDKNLNVRIKAAWSAANLCDALVSVREHSIVPASFSSAPTSDATSVQELLDTRIPTDDIPQDTLTALAKQVLLASKDNDKVRCNAVRALGNFVRFATRDLFLDASVPQLVGSMTGSANVQPLEVQSTLLRSIIDALLFYTTEGSAKVRWNACYGLANFFHNHIIAANTTNKAIATLLNVLQNSTNFKVRINASTALLVATASRIVDNSTVESILRGALVQLRLIARDPSQTDPVDSSQRQFSDQYTSSLRDHLSKLVVSSMFRLELASLSPLLRDYKPEIETALFANFELRSSESTEPSPSAAPHDSEDHDDAAPSSSTLAHLNAPGAEELRLIAGKILRSLGYNVDGLQ